MFIQKLPGKGSFIRLYAPAGDCSGSCWGKVTAKKSGNQIKFFLILQGSG
jgi:hypothetical protein